MRSRNVRIAAGIVVIAASAPPLHAQTDYYNTDAGRPVRVEDAYPTERYAFELQLAPLRLERSSGGVYHWEIAPEIAYGILPRTHVEVGFPISISEGEGDGTEANLAGIEISALHNLNIETRTLPAFGVAADVLLPVGASAPSRVYPSVTGIATRTFRLARLHANASYTLGSAPEAGSETGEVSRWMAGVAVDRTLPLRSMLLIADVFAEQPLGADDELEWNVEAGLRYQLNPFFALDAGIGHRLTGHDRGWSVTFGAARAFGIRALMPVGR